MVAIQKNEKGELALSDAFLSPVITGGEIKTAGGAMRHLCMNILAGRLDPEIAEAIAKKGGIARLFNGSLDDQSVSALKKVTKVTPDAMRKAWAAYVARMSRVRTISLQSMAKALVEPKEPTATLKDAMTAYFAGKTADKIDADLYDIAVQFDLLPKVEA
jgi:hypothetical protein